jgi:hypothetical protein
MPLQKAKKKKPKPASDKSVKQVVTQVVKVNIGDTKPKKKRKRKSGGGVARSAAPPPMLAQVPQQFIYPPQSFPQEAPMAPPRQAPPSGLRFQTHFQYRHSIVCLVQFQEAHWQFNQKSSVQHL